MTTFLLGFLIGLLLGFGITLYAGFRIYKHAQQKEAGAEMDEAILNEAAERIALQLLEQDRKAMLS